MEKSKKIDPFWDLACLCTLLFGFTVIAIIVATLSERLALEKNIRQIIKEELKSANPKPMR